MPICPPHPHPTPTPLPFFRAPALHPWCVFLTLRRFISWSMMPVERLRLCPSVLAAVDSLPPGQGGLPAGD